MTVTADALDLLAGDSPRTRKPGDFQRHPTTGAPYVNHPTETTHDGTPKRVMYGRPSSFGAPLDNPYNLVKWKERQLLIGAWILEHAIGYGDILSGDLPDRDALDQLAARCHDAAGSHLAADQGTHIHLLLEREDTEGLSDWNPLWERGEAFGIPAILQYQIVDQWRAFRQRLGVTAVGIEQTVVNDRWRLAGTLDRLDVPERDILTAYGILAAGEAFVGDIKTGGLTLGGDGQPNRWVKHVVQLAAYVDGVPYDTETDERLDGDMDEPRPYQPNPDIALIYHYDLARALNGEQVDWQAIPVNVAAGREGGDLCRAAADFAKRRDLFAMPAPSKNEERDEQCADTIPISVSVREVDQPDLRTALHDSPMPQASDLERSVAASPAIAAPVSSAVEQQAAEPEAPVAQTASSSAADPDRLRARIRELIDAGHETRIRRLWPDGVLPLSKGGHPPDELELILQCVRAVEAEVGTGWHPDDGAPPHVNTDPRAEVDYPKPETEVYASVYEIIDLNVAFDKLDANGRTLCAQVAGEANAAGRPISVSQDPTVRRWSIARAVIAWAASGRTVDDLWCAASLLATFDQCASADTTLGGLVSQFTIAQADRLYDAATVTS